MKQLAPVRVRISTTPSRNLTGFSVDEAKLLKVLDEQEVAVRRLVKNTGVVFQGAINGARAPCAS